MRRLLLLPVLVPVLVPLLAGCGGTSPEDRCRAQGYADPAVREQTERSNTQLQQVRAPALMQRDALLAAAIRRCLAGEGLAPRGGVEAAKPF